MNVSARRICRRTPAALKLLEPDQRKLYDLIWKRTLASQMEVARLERTTVDDRRATMVRSACAPPVRSYSSKGFSRSMKKAAMMQSWMTTTNAYRRLHAGRFCRTSARLRPNSTSPNRRRAIPRRHWSNVWKSLGIGRPSTYASVVTTIQDREYVRKEKNRLIPEDKGRLVTAFLENYFRKYVGYELHRGSGRPTG